jgi:hypothetical protein
MDVEQAHQRQLAEDFPVERGERFEEQEGEVGVEVDAVFDAVEVLEFGAPLQGFEPRQLRRHFLKGRPHLLAFRVKVNRQEPPCVLRVLVHRLPRRPPGREVHLIAT